MAKKTLTNERLKKLFISNFALVNYAIEVGRNYVLAGHFDNLDDLIIEIRRRAESVEIDEDKKKFGIK